MIITSLIATLILIIIEKMLIFIARIRNQKVDIISDQYQLSVHIKSNYQFICASLVQSSVEMVYSKILQFKQIQALFRKTYNVSTGTSIINDLTIAN